LRYTNFLAAKIRLDIALGRANIFPLREHQIKMTQAGFRSYDAVAGDFPIVAKASTDATALPDLAPVTFAVQDVATNQITTREVTFKSNGDNTSSLSIEVPASPSNIMFALQVRFPAGNPADKPLKIAFLAKNNTSVLDTVLPGDMPIVFANYVMHFS
jgi:hypothetical protein